VAAPTVQLTFDLVDRNNDGVITRDEASRYPSLAENFDMLDRNRSNSLDPQRVRGLFRGSHRAAATAFACVLLGATVAFCGRLPSAQPKASTRSRRATS
jgi:hypothetical protein